MERDGFEIYYVEDPDDQPVEEGVSDWCEFKLIDESFDGTNRTYTLRYTIATKEELETWYEKRLSDDGYLKILKTVESYYSSGAFLLDFLAPEEFVEEDVIGTSFTIEDDPLEVLSQEPFGSTREVDWRWIVTDNSILTLTWNTPAWFPADDDWKMQDTQALFQRIDDAMQDQG